MLGTVRQAGRDFGCTTSSQIHYNPTELETIFFRKEISSENIALKTQILFKPPNRIPHRTLITPKDTSAYTHTQCRSPSTASLEAPVWDLV